MMIVLESRLFLLHRSFPTDNHHPWLLVLFTRPLSNNISVNQTKGKLTLLSIICLILWMLVCFLFLIATTPTHAALHNNHRAKTALYNKNPEQKRKNLRKTFIQISSLVYASSQWIKGHGFEPYLANARHTSLQNDLARLSSRPNGH